MSPVNLLLLNGNPKATAIVRFDHSACLIVKGKKKDFPNIDEIKKHIEKKGMELNIEHIHPASIRPESTREWNIPLPEKGFWGEMMRGLFRTT